jgi:hypothetical protein
MQGRARRPAREFEELVCRDDGHAVYLAKRFVLDHDVEVWSGNRFVFRLECEFRGKSPTDSEMMPPTYSD